jgi:hypothetical protein
MQYKSVAKMSPFPPLPAVPFNSSQFGPLSVQRIFLYICDEIGLNPAIEAGLPCCLAADKATGERKKANH